MTTHPITIVRVYIRESEGLLDKVVHFLREDAHASGLTVFRGVAGYSGDKPSQSAYLQELSIDLPLVLEFYETPERADAIIRSLTRRFPLPHLVSWHAELHSASS